MKTHLVRMSMIAVFAAAAMSAQSPRAMKANIPFDFTVGKVVLPAGEYSVRHASDAGAILIRSADGKTGAAFFANRVQARDEKMHGELVFNRYGNEYYLSQIWAAGSDVGHEMGKTPRERELAAAASTKPVKILASR